MHHNSEADWRCILDCHPELAVRWIQFAAERGFKTAQLVLGQMHLDGRGVSCDPVIAYSWFERAARIGSLDARNMLGRCHEFGWGVTADHAAAMTHYRKAAAAGHPWALYNVGCLLLYGKAERNHAKAFRHFMAATEAGHAEARAKAFGLLGRCHEEGWGTPVDRAAALRCYQLAAEGGDCWGALNLGLLALDAGRKEVAMCELERAVALATPHARDAIARTLSRHPDPAVAKVVSHIATSRADRTAAASQTLDPRSFLHRLNLRHRAQFCLALILVFVFVARRQGKLL
ncbi:TPR repeat protein [Methylobacterium brachiatum]|uniref:TPR repeat protein n=1 Tax=Methylobacterium brachiatum TaxID=269660 RepID=A0AAJ1U009_9HYPH|nr:tetratricopeptide repeat protein [Methylobacterium brachiatum]MCB4805568.1 sel1 repeat family protein [Methylobacterium brachiatum]MDQ0546782.1 TPR repeat protein [Methylobacterium brachiatum]